MISEITFKNYKAFAEGTLKIKPITILLGTNSSGKSSLIQLILLLGQSLQAVEFSEAFKLNGEFVSFGESINVLHNRDESKKFSIRFDFSEIAIDLESLRSNFGQGLFMSVISTISSSSFSSEEKKRVFRLFEGKYDEFNVAEISKILAKTFKNIESNKKEISSESLDEYKKLEELEEKVKPNIVQILDVLKLLSSDTDMKTNNIRYGFHFNKQKKQFEVKSLGLYFDDTKILEYSNRRDNGRVANDLNSDVFPQKILDKYRIQFGKSVQFKKLFLDVIDGHSHYLGFFDRGMKNPLFSLMISIFDKITYKVFEPILDKKLYHVSPLRAFPQRYYMIDQTYMRNSLNTREGDSLAEILNRKREIVGLVNSWFSKFGLGVEIEGVREVFHSIKINQNGLELDIIDVGFGLSQVLPVVVQGFLSEPSSLTLIEQPEIHLHPKMQAELADLFIDIIKHERKYLLIETHSESLLKRLRRRIAEGVIDSQDVAIFFVHGKSSAKGSAILENIAIAENGAFNWPKDFSDTEIQDTLEFIKHQ